MVKRTKARMTETIAAAIMARVAFNECKKSMMPTKNMTRETWIMSESDVIISGTFQPTRPT